MKISRHCTTPPPSITPAEREQAILDAKNALAEDVGTGDISAPLVGDKTICASLFCKSATILCGSAWFEACFCQIEKETVFDWRMTDGTPIAGNNDLVCVVQATATTVMAAERSALNFIQTLSATAAAAHQWQKLAGDAVVVDTRKTLPLLRRAQKYAVRVGGAKNHRQGLFDEILIKENHIAAAGGIPAALSAAFAITSKEFVQIEARNLEEMHLAIANGARRILLDNFNLDNLRHAVKGAPAEVELEASGGIGKEQIAAIAATGVHRISVGAITKNIQAADFSLLVQ